MADIVIVGGGVIGLMGSMMLARDGHHVTVLERDPASPPADPGSAWDEWERRGVNQFRMLHSLLARFRATADAELPEMVAALDAAGALRSNPMRDAPEAITGGFRPGDERFDVVTGTRPFLEAVIARCAAETDGVTIRRGVAVQGLIAGEPRHGVPHVAGVVTDDGTEHRADLVVEAGGRRSALPRWIAALGAAPPYEELDRGGFVYFARHFRSPDGALPVAFGPLLQHYESVSVLTLPGDNGLWGVGLIAKADDAAMRALRDADVWMRVLKSYPLMAHWGEGVPITGVDAMSKIEDRYRSYVVNDDPVVTGVLPLGDSWACTNPSVGRGFAIGILQASALRAMLRADDLRDPWATALTWDRLSADEVEPHYRDTLHFDRHRLAQIDAQIAGRPYETDDPAWHQFLTLTMTAVQDPELFRGYMGLIGMLERMHDVATDPAIAARIATTGVSPEPFPGPSRAELLGILTQ